VTGEKAEDSRFGWFSDPMPLSETTYLCSYTPTVQPWLERSWGLYVGDRHGNLALVYRDPDISCAEPTPVTVRPAPQRRAPAPSATADAGEARLMMLDVHEGLKGVRRGEAKFLRIVEDLPRKGVHTGGVVVTAATNIYTAKRVLGTVPIRPDGSADFVVPANRNIYFEALDADQREIQRMRSVITLKPGERRTCIGCHEPRTSTPRNARSLTGFGAPDKITPPEWGDRAFSFPRDVQPILNAKCVGCHTHDRAANGVILTDDLTDRFSVAYEELVPHISAANAMRWDNPSDVYPQPAYTYGSRASRLAKMLEAGHHGVALSQGEWARLAAWIDTNGVYYDRYESAYPDRVLFNGATRAALSEVTNRRCASCHGKGGDGRYGTWWLSLNRRDPGLSRALMAPLARSAGGWERCDGPVFADKGDPDYVRLASEFRALSERLRQTPREDLMAIRGETAERQQVVIPPPPPRRKAEPLPVFDGAYLSDLPWLSASAGWSADGDGKPRRDRDVEDNPLRLGTRPVRKGIGTHAPSEVAIRLDAAYARFTALVACAEAGGSVVFRIYGDDKPLYDSGIVRGVEPARPIDLPIAGVRILRLAVTDAGDGINADMATWAEARVLR
jgi:mono/diheme cytochrome c family protein